jgi:cell division inhibitor SepF
MEELAYEERRGIFGRLAGMFTRPDEVEADVPAFLAERKSEPNSSTTPSLRQEYRYTVTVRRQITAFDDAMAAANGLKRGEQQILNLSATDPTTRQKIVDFMCGVNFAQEGTWEEIGENVYMIVPSNAFVEVAPPTPRMQARNN